MPRRRDRKKKACLRENKEKCEVDWAALNRGHIVISELLLKPGADASLAKVAGSTALPSTRPNTRNTPPSRPSSATVPSRSLAASPHARASSAPSTSRTARASVLLQRLALAPKVVAVF